MLCLNFANSTLIIIPLSHLKQSNARLRTSAVLIPFIMASDAGHKPAKISLPFNARKSKPNTTTSFTTSATNKLNDAPSRNSRASLLSTDADVDDRPANSTAQISLFGASTGAEAVGEDAPRVIAPLANRKRGRDDGNDGNNGEKGQDKQKRQKSILPRRQQPLADTDGNGNTLNDDDSKPKWGLNVREAAPSRSPPSKSDVEDGKPSNGVGPTANGNGTERPTDEQEALDRLMGKTSEPQTTIAPLAILRNEEDAFRTDYASAPRQPTLEEYAATPVEGFGAALMRGYLPAGETLEGWKERVEARVNAARKDKKAKKGPGEVERRNGLLGLGAKEMDLGKDKDGKDRTKKKISRREAMEYNPLARQHKVTGEIVGELDFRERLEAGKKGDSGSANIAEVDAGREGRNGDSRKLLENGERRNGHEDGLSSQRERHREHDDDEYYRERKDKERRREREQDRERDRDGEHDDDEYYRERKDKGRRPDRERDRDVEYTRDRDSDRRRTDRERGHVREDRQSHRDYHDKSSRRDNRHRDRSKDRERQRR